MALLIKNGQIVTADSRYTADIFCKHDTITRIGHHLDAPPDAEVIDAAGKYVFPGFIDPHTHIYLPFMGTFAKDDYATASRAALLGGTTTLIDFCIPGHDEEPLDAIQTWNTQSEGRASCDYSYHMAITRFDSLVEEQLRRIVEMGVASFKVFLAYKGALGVSDAELYQAFRLAKELGVIICGHCENAEAIASRQAELLAAGKTGPQWHHESRPPFVEALGVHQFLTFARLHDAAAYIVHLSCAVALENALLARRDGARVWIETLIQYLLLDKEHAEQGNFEGAKYVMSPPLRDAVNQPVLWNALHTGAISVLATDHAPFDFKTQKRMGAEDFTKIPNGIPALQDRVNLLYTHGVKAGRIDLHRFVDAASTQAARIFGLFPRKGTIAPGSDADLVIYDPEHPGTISAATHAMNVDYSAFEGFKIAGRADTVTLRGEVVVRDGHFVEAAAGRGQFIRREPGHF